MMRFALAVLALTGLAAPAAHAATLQGDQFDVSYYYPSRSSLYFDAGTFTDPSKRIAIPQDPKGYGNLYPAYFHYVFGQTVHFTPASFDGVVFTDETSKDIIGATFDKSTTATGLTASDLSFTSNSVSLNLSGITVQAGTVINVDVKAGTASKALFAMGAGVPTVPLPASAPMFGGALAIVGAVGFGMKRRRATAV